MKFNLPYRGTSHTKILSHQTQVRVRFSEIDSMHIVWHGEYLRYFEDGREAGKQFAEYFFFFIGGRKIFAGAVHVCFGEEKLRAEALPGEAKQFAYGTFVFVCHEQQGAESFGMLECLKHLNGTKGIRTGQGRDVFGMVICCQTECHTCKFRVFFENLKRMNYICRDKTVFL